MGAPNGASDEARTRYLHLGKVALYQMSYTRNNSDYYSKESKNVKYKMKKVFWGRNKTNSPMCCKLAVEFYSSMGYTMPERS